MDSRDRRDGVSYLVSVLRKVTRFVQITPFAYLFFLAVYLLAETFLPGWSLGVLDNLLFVPAYTAVGMLLLGRVLKLCSWFRTACLLPFTTRAESYVDSFIFQFTECEITIVNTAIAVTFIVFIYLTIRHFFLHGRVQK